MDPTLRTSRFWFSLLFFMLSMVCVQLNAYAGNPPVKNDDTERAYTKGSYFGVSVSGLNEMAASSTTVSASSTNVSCFGGSDGTASAVASGGTPPYTYNWSNGGNSSTITGLPAGTYTITVTDALGCLALNTPSVNITQPSMLNVVIGNQTNIDCNTTTGSATASASGGTPAYTYVWSNGMTTATVMTVSAGTFTVTVTDNNGCTATSSTIITADQTPPIAIAGPDQVLSCSSPTIQLNGSASSSGSGIFYNWSTTNGNIVSGATSSIATVNQAGDYTLLVTNSANGCTASDVASVTNPPTISVIGNITDVLCNGESNGSIDVTVNGGTPNYTYDWSDNSLDGIEDPGGLSAGTFTITVTDANGCAASASFTVNEPSAISSSGVVTDVSCNGDSDGSIDLTVSGGTPAYTYTWSNGATVQDPTGLNAGTFTVTITDGNSCTSSASFTVTEPSAINLSGVVTDVSCNGDSDGSIDLTVSGGTPAYTYTWSNGATVEDPGNLSAGTFTVTVTDGGSCTASASFTVTEPSALNLSGVVTDVSCNGDSDGSINLTVSGGTPAYTYTWSNGATVEDPGNLSAGTFTVTVTDGGSCTASASFTVTEPSALNLSGVVTDVSCNGDSDGSIDLTVSGGTPAYTYTWSNGATVEDPGNLSAGTFTVTVTDGGSCTASASFTVTEPSALSLSGVVTDVSCNGDSDGSINLTVSGGTPAYTYTWSNGATVEDLSNLSAGTFTVTVTDGGSCTASASFTVTEPPALNLSGVVTDVSCNGDSDGSIDLTVSGGAGTYAYTWSNGATVEDLNNLSAGTYTVTVADANGCSSSSSYMVNEPSEINLNTSVTEATCGACNGSIDLSVTGGTTLYSYLWSNGAITEDINGLCAGNYTVTVTDNNGCTSTIGATVNSASLPTVSATSTPVTCFGSCDGTVTATAQGGAPPYSYRWNDPGAAQTAQVIGLCAGTYTVTVTDDNGCTATATTTITEPTDLMVDVTSTNETMAGANDGTATATASGGTPAYTYLWSTGATTSMISSLAPGSYTVTVTDANGCTESGTTNINSVNCNISLNLSGQSPLCNGESTGSATVTITGAVDPVTYNWSSGGSMATENGLAAGTYTVTVTGGDNCSAVGSITIDEPAALQLSVVVTNVDCFGQCNGRIDLTVTGGTAPYAYAWSQNDTVEDPGDLCAGSYTVTVTDDNGCTAEVSATVTEPTELTLNVSATDIMMNGANDGTATADVSGGTPGYTYLWDNNAITQTITDLSPGQYCVTVTDANGCTAEGCATVGGVDCSNFGIESSANNVSCNGGNDGQITATGVAGMRPFSYDWSNGNTTDSTLTGLTAGIYTLTLTDAIGCTATASFTITEPTALVLDIATQNASPNNSDGSASANVAGGTMPYTYSWSNGGSTATIDNLSPGTYCVTVVDNNGCQISDCGVVVSDTCSLAVTVNTTDVSCNGGNDGSAILDISGGTMPYNTMWSSGDGTNLTAGNYSVTVTDAANCEVVRNFTIDEPSALGVMASISGENLCFGDCNVTIGIDVNGGTAPYSFSWSSGETTPQLGGLCAGVYTLTVTDSNGCTLQESITITEPTELNLQLSVTNETMQGANNGTASAMATGGTPGYSYSWSNGETTTMITGLAPGEYCVTVTDANGCTEEDCMLVLSGACTLTLIATSDNFTCPNTCEGTIGIGISNGMMPFTYTWSDTTIGNTAIATDLCAGTYTVTVTDGAGCTAMVTATVDEWPEMIAQIAATPESCPGACDATASITVTGGTPPYSFDGGPFIDLCEGSYSFSITDANGCMIAASFSITSPPELGVNIDTVGNATTGQSNGFIDITPSGGTLPYTYLWSLNGMNISTDEDPTGLAAGTYDLVITDANGCQLVTMVIVDEVTSVRPLSETNEIRFLPNPVTGGEAYLRFDMSRSTPVQLQLYDLKGRQIREIQYDALQKDEIILDLHYLAPGMYHLMIRGDEFQYVEKVVVIKQ